MEKEKEKIVLFFRKENICYESIHVYLKKNYILRLISIENGRENENERVVHKLYIYI